MGSSSVVTDDGSPGDDVSTDPEDPVSLFAASAESSPSVAAGSIKFLF